MQTVLCILIIILSVVLFWIGMLRSNHADSEPFGKVEAMFRKQGEGDFSANGNQTAPSDAPADLPIRPTQANDRARATLFIALPATNHPRSRAEAFSLKESYLSLHQEFIFCDQFLDHLARQLRFNSEDNSLLAGSFEDGPIPLVEILRNRLFCSLEGAKEGNRAPILVVETLGETPQAAERLAELVQREYLSFIAKDETMATHPKLARLGDKLNEAREERRSWENDLAAFRRLNKEPAKKDQQAGIQARLTACRADKSKQVAHLREITQAFASSPEDIGTLVDLEGLAGFKQPRLLRENLRQLESSMRKYEAEGNRVAVAAHEKTAQSIRIQLQSEIHLAVAVLKDRFQRLLDLEMQLSENLVAAKNDFTELALKYPKAQQLEASRRSAATLESKLKLASSTWVQARKLLMIKGLSESLPPLRLQPLSP